MTHELRLAACAIMASMIVAAQMARATEEGGFISSANPGDWRASKLVGASILGPDDKNIGKIDDVIVDATGATKVVVGVGGFLGVGRKEVGMPFSQIKWSDTPPPMKAPATGAPGTLPPLATAPPPVPPTGPAEANKRVNDYPDHGSVAVTKDQLKAAPEFHYASERP